MTATTGDLRDRLAAALEQLPLHGLDSKAVVVLAAIARAYPEEIADALLPVVESYGRACAATALRDAADRDVLRRLVDTVAPAIRPSRNARDAQEQLRAVREALAAANEYLRQTAGVAP